MVVYDCDDEAQFAALEERVQAESLIEKNTLSAIAPDTLAEARNRGFRPANAALGSPVELGHEGGNPILTEEEEVIAAGNQLDAGTDG